jgi:drug/metabolite transporter (DMT)-like permease
MTSLLLMIQPVGSVILAALILSESPSPLQLFGVSLVLGALLVATAPRRALRRREPAMVMASLRPSRFRARS